MAPINSTSQTQHQYPSRIKSFCRQNQNNLRRRALVPLLYISLGICYIYGLLFHNLISSKIYLKDGSISDAPTEMELEPQSLSHVALSNAEVLWKKRVQREEFIKRRAQIRKEHELHKKSLEELQKKRSNNTAADVKGGDSIWAIPDESNKLLSGKSNGTITSKGRSLAPKRRIGSKGYQSSKHDAALPFVLIITVCTIFRLVFQMAISRLSGDIEDDDEQQAGSGTFWTRRQLRRRARAQIRQRQFQTFVDRLNAQRVENGERPITADSLRLVVSDRDFNGNDYERLWQFHEENGPAIGSFLSTIGATEAEIGRCPSRVLTENDDLVRGDGAAPVDGHSCSVCLEAYRVGDEVRSKTFCHDVLVLCSYNDADSIHSFIFVSHTVLSYLPYRMY